MNGSNSCHRLEIRFPPLKYRRRLPTKQLTSKSCLLARRVFFLGYLVLSLRAVPRHVTVAVYNTYNYIISHCQTHLPGYVADYEQLKAKGVQVVACLTVNDAFVTAAWGESCGTGGKVRMLADATAAYTKVLYAWQM